MNDLTKLDLTKDSFIYSVNQAYEARIKNNGSFNSHLKYEPFLEKTWALPQNPNINSLKKTLSEIIEHHYTKLPNYRREESVNIENISWFSHSMATLFADTEYLLLAYTGHGFPVLPDTKIPRTNSSKNIVSAINKYCDFKNTESNGEKFTLFPLAGEDNVNADAHYTQEIWSLIFYFIKKSFGNYTELLSSYATWKYVLTEDSSDVVDWNVRPPCGDLYRKQFKHLFEKDYFKNNSHSKKSAPPHSHSPAKETASKEMASRETTSTSNNNSDTSNRSNQFQDNRQDYKASKPPFRDRKERFQRPEREERPNQDEVIAKALEEVSVAIKKLQKNPNLNEIELAPQNSFIRRQQHVVISEAGYETESRGEADSRCVCILVK